MPVLARKLVITLGLVVAGAGAGAFAALAAGVALCLATFGWPTEPPDAFLFGLIAGVGAVFGAPLGPVVGWTLLRQVPLWAGLGGATLGAGAGAVAALGAAWVLRADSPVEAAGIGAALGAVCVGAALNVRAAQTRVGAPRRLGALQLRGSRGRAGRPSTTAPAGPLAHRPPAAELGR